MLYGACKAVLASGVLPFGAATRVARAACPDLSEERMVAGLAQLEGEGRITAEERRGAEERLLARITERKGEELMQEDRPRPVVRRAQVAAVLNIALVGLGIALVPEVQSLVVDLILLVGIPAAVSLVTLVQAKLAERKVTPIEDARLPWSAPVGRYGAGGPEVYRGDSPYLQEPGRGEMPTDPEAYRLGGYSEGEDLPPANTGR